MSQRTILLIGRTQTYPVIERNDNNDIIALYAYEKDKIEIEIAEKNGKCEYYMLILQKTDSDQLPTLEKVSSEWNSLFGGTIKSIELLTDNRNLIKKSFRQMFDNGPDDLIQFNLPVVGFITDSTKTEKEARRLLEKASLKKQWQIWK